jgi:hypothetical protein
MRANGPLLRIARGLLLAFASGMLLSSCYRSHAIDGTVLDEQSGKPMPETVVVAIWQARGPGIDVNTEGQLGVMETITDDHGHYAFPEWGPRLKWFGKVSKVSTRLMYFKRGYQGLVVAIEAVNSASIFPNMDLSWSNKKVTLHTAASSPRPRIEEFDMFNLALRPIMSNVAACPWKQIPAMLREVHQERLALQPHALDSDAWPLSTVDDDVIANADNLAKLAGSACGSPKEVFQLQSPPR